MSSHGRGNRGVASQTAVDGPSTLLRIKSEPLSELSLSAISISQESGPTIELPIKSEPQSGPQLSSIPQTPEDVTGIEPSGDGDQNVILSTTPQLNLQDAISRLVENSKFKPSDINTDPSVALGKLLDLKTPIKLAAIHSKNGKSRDPEQWEKLNLFLYILSSLDTVTPEFSNTLNLRSVLEILINPIFNFPQEYSDISQALIVKIEGQNGFQAPPSPPVSKTNIESATSNSRKRRSPSSETPTSAKKSRNNSLSSSPNVVPPPSDHPIWGANGIMRGLVRDGTSIKLIEEKIHTFKKKFNRFGHNDLTVGDCWPKQIVALRDGAHGCPQGGISGTAETGAYSIIISKHYEGFDQDLGDTIYYSAPGAKDSIAKEPDSEKTGVKALKRSIETRNPVRVLRAAGCAWNYGPAAGIRYDGLYRVIKGDVGTNGKGGKFWRFTLRRLENQDPIKVHLPDRETIGLFERVKEGY
ncbi:b77b7ef2-fbe0-409f-9868-34181a126fd5 [Sclerotinia trifoliorum]|uniref:B77b7ef2-fbe0-409f-9868-34181a126fd5 n=1 Tax=Sclerotinia trifoliorum TaxID=28548 RepID=A0A8H2W2A1_9HELO|nr:b77b7ef2-fbe0-409f-9868-34181a126fd5 [Sclerotinia trifoliorum]